MTSQRDWSHFDPKPWPKLRLPPRAGAITGDDIDGSLLPPTLERFVHEIARSQDVPLIAALVPALVVCSSVLGRAIRPDPYKPRYLEQGNIWGLLVAGPGSQKSPVIAEALRPLKQVATKMAVAHGEQRPKLEAELTILEAQKKAVEGQARRTPNENSLDTSQLADELADSYRRIEKLEAKMALPRLLVTDATAEALAREHSANPHGLLLHSDEISAIFDPKAKYQETLRSFLLEAWSGSEAKESSRVGSAALRLECVRISALGAIQPLVLEGLRRGKGLDLDGFLQRFQAIAVPRYEDVGPSSAAFEPDAAEEVRLWIERRVTERAPRGPVDYPVLEFSGEAQALFLDFQRKLRNDVRRRTREGVGSGFDAYEAKRHGFVARLALLFAVLEEETAAEVPLATLEAAINLSAAFAAHARNLYPESKELRSTRALLDRIEMGEVADGATLRSVKRPRWSELANQDAVDSAISELERRGVLRLEKVRPRAGGRPSLILRIRPDLHEAMDEDARVLESTAKTAKTHQLSSFGSFGSSRPKAALRLEEAGVGIPTAIHTDGVKECEGSFGLSTGLEGDEELLI